MIHINTYCRIYIDNAPTDLYVQQSKKVTLVFTHNLGTFKQIHIMPYEKYVLHNEQSIPNNLIGFERDIRKLISTLS